VISFINGNRNKRNKEHLEIIGKVPTPAITIILILLEKVINKKDIPPHVVT
jgi:uncharacterized protein YlzI (FlbEa/FlbD family)